MRSKFFFHKFERALKNFFILNTISSYEQILILHFFMRGYKTKTSSDLVPDSLIFQAIKP
jgi:hypothetical protein